MARPRQYKQLAMFDAATLYQPVQPVLPPGLRELADADGLDERQVRQLADMWHTIRGQRPETLDAWRELIELLRPILEEVWSEQHADSEA